MKLFFMLVLCLCHTLHSQPLVPLATLVDEFHFLRKKHSEIVRRGEDIPPSLSEQLRRNINGLAQRGVEAENFLFNQLTRVTGELQGDVVEGLLSTRDPRVSQRLWQRLEQIGEFGFLTFFEQVPQGHLQCKPTELERYVNAAPYWQRNGVMTYLSRIGTPQAVEHLLECPNVDRDRGNYSEQEADRTLAHLRRVLLDLKDPLGIRALLKAFTSKPRHFAQGMEQHDVRVLVQVASALGPLGCRDALPLLRGCLRHNHTALAVEAARSIGVLARKESFLDLKRAFERRSDGEFPLVALEALARIDPHHSQPLLLRAASSSYWRLRCVAARGLGQLDDEKSVSKLLALLSDDCWQVRKGAFEVLSRRPTRELVETLIANLEQQRGHLRSRIFQALVAWTGQNLGPDPQLWKEFWKHEGKSFTIVNAPLPKGRTAVNFGDPTIPRYFGLEILSQDIAFLIDTSGSMTTPYPYCTPLGDVRELRGIDLVKRELWQTLQKLEEEQSFNVVSFASAYRPLFAKPKGSQPRTLKSARKFLQSMIAQGATNLFDPLSELVSLGQFETIYVLSDGQPTSGRITESEAFLEEMRALNTYSQATIHCIALGANSELLERLAQQSGGEYRRIDKNFVINPNPTGKDNDQAGEGSDTRPAPPTQRGQFTMTFEERSPLSAMPKLASRDRFNAKSGTEEYALKDHPFELYVPANYTHDVKKPQFGLFVWIDPSPQGRIPYPQLLEEKKLIGISPYAAGNEASIWVRSGVALDAVHNMELRYAIDRNRIYVAGFSGGARMASRLGVMYADIFSGAFCIDGADWWTDLPADETPGKWFKGRYQKPKSSIFNSAKRKNRYVLMTGQHDGNRAGTRAVYQQGFKRAGFKKVRYMEIPGKGHAVPSAEFFAEGLKTLDGE